MKARIKATGEVLRVLDLDSERVLIKYGSEVIFLKIHEVDLIPESHVFSNEIDWEQRKYEIAKDIMSAQLSDGESAENNSKEVLAKWAIVYADALIKELKKGEDEQ